MILPSKCQFLHSNVVSRKPRDLTWCFPPGVARFPSRSDWSWRHGGQDLTRLKHPLKNTKVGLPCTRVLFNGVHWCLMLIFQQATCTTGSTRLLRMEAPISPIRGFSWDMTTPTHSSPWPWVFQFDILRSSNGTRSMVRCVRALTWAREEDTTESKRKGIASIAKPLLAKRSLAL